MEKCPTAKSRTTRPPSTWTGVEDGVRTGRGVLWVLEDEGSYRGVKVINQLRYLNHSLKPNADFWGTALYATRAIKPGEELTFYNGGG